MARMERKVHSDDKGLWVSAGGWVIRPNSSTRALRGDTVVISTVDPIHRDFGVVSVGLVGDARRERWVCRNSEVTPEVQRALAKAKAEPELSTPDEGFAESLAAFRAARRSGGQPAAEQLLRERMLAEAKADREAQRPGDEQPED